MTLAAAAQTATDRLPDLQSCPDLGAPAGAKVVFHAYAVGVQIYRWTGTSWTFVAPQAALYADASATSLIGTHYAGPTWESISGSKVAAMVSKRCLPNPDAIQWLLLEAVANDGVGIFDRVTHIHRVNTVGGTAPAAPGNQAGDTVGVPYTAEYFFYRVGN